MSYERPPDEVKKNSSVDRMGNFERYVLWGVLGLLLLFVVAVFWPVQGDREASANARSLSNVKQQALAVAIYETDFDDRFPQADIWMEAIAGYVKNDDTYRDPTIKNRRDDQYGYAFFSPLSGVSNLAISEPGGMPLTFQSTDLSRNANGLLNLLPYRLEKQRGNTVSFLDFHAKAMPDTWRFDVIVVDLRHKP